MPLNGTTSHAPLRIFGACGSTLTFVDCTLATQLKTTLMRMMAPHRTLKITSLRMEHSGV